MPVKPKAKKDKPIEPQALAWYARDPVAMVLYQLVSYGEKKRFLNEFGKTGTSKWTLGHYFDLADLNAKVEDEAKIIVKELKVKSVLPALKSAGVTQPVLIYTADRCWDLTLGLHTAKKRSKGLKKTAYSALRFCLALDFDEDGEFKVFTWLTTYPKKNQLLSDKFKSLHEDMTKGQKSLINCVSTNRDDHQKGRVLPLFVVPLTEGKGGRMRPLDEVLQEVNVALRRECKKGGIINVLARLVKR